MLSTAMFTGIAALAPLLAPVALQSGNEIEVALIFETNATDNDAEIVLDIASDDAIDRLLLLRSSDRPVLFLGSNDGTGLGLSQAVIESAEPSVAAVTAAYPEGLYAALVRTTDHVWTRVSVLLSHELPNEPVFTSPLAGESLGVSGAVIAWQPDSDVESWKLELEHDDLGLELEVTLPGNVNSFSVPDGYLVVGEEFELAIGATGPNGNLIVVETSFDVE